MDSQQPDTQPVAEHQTANLYVASSWRNPHYEDVIKVLHSIPQSFLPVNVYDFRNPPERSGFAWSEIDPNWKLWSFDQYKAALDHPIAQAGYDSDMSHVKSADAVILVLPCGASAHSEAGYAAGAGKPVYVLFPKNRMDWEPELMYKMYAGIFTRMSDLLDALRSGVQPILSQKFRRYKREMREQEEALHERDNMTNGVPFRRGESVDVDALAAQGRAAFPDSVPETNAPRDGMAS